MRKEIEMVNRIKIILAEAIEILKDDEQAKETCNGCKRLLSELKCNYSSESC